MTVLTFPTSPTLGQQYDAPNGIQYVFDGVKWTVETVASTSAAVTDSMQDRVAPMFVDGDHTGITFAYNAATNVMSADVTAVNGNQLVNGVHEFTLESNGTLSLDGDPFVITSDSLVNSASSFSVSSDGTLTLTHPPESDPIVHPLSTILTIQKAAGNYHTISGAYGLSLQATPVPSGYGLNTNTNFVDIFHDGISVNVNDNTWGFGTDGATTFPTLTVPISDNASPSGTGQTIKFSDSTQQAIIYGPESTAGATSAQRVIIQGAPGYTGTTGEGGDIYLWAGPGGSLNGNGGDIKVRAGRGTGPGEGGYLNFQAGDTGSGAAGYINIESGESNTYGSGGDITVQARSGGEITLRTYGPGGTNNWLFDADGVLTLPEGSYITETAAPLGTAKSLDLHPGNPIYPTQYLRIYPTNGGDADHLHLTSGDLTATELFLGDDEQYVKLTNTGNVEIRTGALDYYNDTKGVWTLDSDGVLTLPTHNNTPGSRIKSAVDITIETERYYLVDLVDVAMGSVVGGIGTLDFLISAAPDWATKVAVGDHVVSGTWTDIVTVVAPAGDVNRWTVTFASGDFAGNDSKWSFYKPGAAGGAWNFGADGALTLPSGYPILFGNGNSRIQAGMGFHVNSEEGISLEAVDATDPLNLITHYWHFGTDGALRYPHNAVQQPTDTVTCAGNTSTVVYTASGQYQHTIKLLIQVEGMEAPETNSWDTQACEMMVAKSFRANNIASTVYGIVHTSTAPLATFSAQWNALTNRIEVLCATPSANNVYVRIFATEIYTAD